MDWKFWLGFALGILGLLGIGSLVEILRRPTVTLESPLNPADLMSTRLVIHNDSWSGFSGLRVTAMATDVKSTFGTLGSAYTGWDSVVIPPDLDAGEEQTIAYPFRGIHFGGTLLSGNFGLIVSYRIKYLPYWERRRGFLFTVAVQADGHSRFEQQPGDEIEREYKSYEDAKKEQDRLRRFFPPT